MKTLLLAIVVLLPFSAAAADPLIVHEWGTFTVLQDENGKPIGGLNTDDEPLPKFVHRLVSFHSGPLDFPRSIFPPGLFQGVPFNCRQDITLRLETPVTYFYVPESFRFSTPIDVTVGFRGGLLTEFYPDANATAPGVDRERGVFGRISPSTTGTLAWPGLRLDPDARGPETPEHVWTSPRNVDSIPVRAPNGEAEQYLFYRGVGNIESPLRAANSSEDGSLTLSGAISGRDFPNGPLSIPKLWLVSVQDDGKAAFRAFGPLELSAGNASPVSVIKPGEEFSHHSTENLDDLRWSMKRALVADGLYELEAEAMLATWEFSYFNSAGLRLFYIVPREWTDRILPIEVSIPADISRVMVGRIELVSPRQRALLAAIASTTIDDFGPVLQALRTVHREHGVLTTPSDLHKLIKQGRVGQEIPEVYRNYLALGRFRNALILDEQRKRPTPQLAAFIQGFGLEAAAIPGS